MKVEDQIRAWKDPKFRAALEAEESLPNPAGHRLVELDEAELRAVWGGEIEDPPCNQNFSCGWICTISAECNTDQSSCWGPIVVAGPD